MNIHWLVGNLVADAETNVTTTGKRVAEMRVATNEGGPAGKFTDYHSVKAWDDLATEASVKAKKGVRIAVEGRVATRTWDDADGKKHWKTETIARFINYLSDSPDDPDLPDSF